MTTYPGGKNQAHDYQFIINQMPPHRVYIEPFLGSGAIIRTKKLAEINIGIELAEEVINNYHSSPTGYTVVNSCGISCLKLLCQTAEADTLIYADPPYPMDSRKWKGKKYKNELSNSDHEQLLSTLLKTKAKVIISTYPNALYADYLSEWRVLEYNSSTWQGSAKELLYMNFPEAAVLHDYRFLGKNKTEKQQIRRKIEREIKKLKALPHLEREAIINAVNDHAVEIDFPVPFSPSLKVI
jgi:DNA adenine methylase